jgi:hypothetical protein
MGREQRRRTTLDGRLSPERGLEPALDQRPVDRLPQPAEVWIHRLDFDPSNADTLTHLG